MIDHDEAIDRIEDARSQLREALAALPRRSRAHALATHSLRYAAEAETAARASRIQDAG